VALSNPSRTETIHLQISARTDSGQRPGGPWAINLPPLGHRAFNLYENPTILNGFSGSIQISSTDDPPSPFVALSLNYRAPVLSPLPPGETTAPAPSDRRPYDVAIRVRQAGVALMGEADPFPLSSSPAEIAAFLNRIGLAVDSDVPVRASYSSTDKKVHLSAGMVEALGTNEAALAFVIAHMQARGVLETFGLPATGTYAGDPEGLADFSAMATLLEGGFDPGGAADFFGRLLYSMEQGLSVESSLRNEFALPNGYATRLEKLAVNIEATCGLSSGMYPICQKARKYWHPHNPANIP
jgi:hypothetical protein